MSSFQRKLRLALSDLREEDDRSLAAEITGTKNAPTDADTEPADSQQAHSEKQAAELGAADDTATATIPVTPGMAVGQPGGPAAQPANDQQPGVPAEAPRATWEPNERKMQAAQQEMDKLAAEFERTKDPTVGQRYLDASKRLDAARQVYQRTRYPGAKLPADQSLQ